MFAPQHDFFRALAKARKATRAGDHSAADRWTRLAERHLAMARRMDQLCAGEQESAAAPSKAAGPVMLDPKGFSPGGTPNWVLNLNRLERAGIKPDANTNK